MIVAEQTETLCLMWDSFIEGDLRKADELVDVRESVFKNRKALARAKIVMDVLPFQP